jgi:hypothetical protein
MEIVTVWVFNYGLIRHQQLKLFTQKNSKQEKSVCKPEKNGPRLLINHCV